MRFIKHLTTWLLLLTVLTASGLVSAKVASGSQNLSGGLHQAESGFNSLIRLAKIDFNYDAASGASVVTKRGRGQQVGSMIKTDGSTTASAIKAKAESVGFKPTQTPNGPLKMIDENGVARVTIKGGSQRAPGSAGSHVELKTSSGQRVNPAGQSVTRKSPENHTSIINDL